MKKQNPRHGSMQFWPRKRANRPYNRVRSWGKPTKVNIAGFAGYKVGMTHVSAVDMRKTSATKNEEIVFPVTVLECPPLRIYSLRLYKYDGYGLQVNTQLNFKPTKDLLRRLRSAKSYASLEDVDKLNAADYVDARVVVYTQPRLTGVSKKTPEVFELSLGEGDVKAKIDFVKSFLNKDIKVSDILKEGEFVDTRGVTKGKGFQGPIRRFGVNRTSHKSEKGVRNPGARSGGWVARAHMMYRVATAGQTGFQQRVDLNKMIVKISSNPEEINPKGDFPHYGKVRGDFVLIKGSCSGARKRLVMFSKSFRIPKNQALPKIEKISLVSKQ